MDEEYEAFSGLQYLRAQGDYSPSGRWWDQNLTISAGRQHQELKALAYFKRLTLLKMFVSYSDLHSGYHCQLLYDVSHSALPLSYIVKLYHAGDKARAEGKIEDNR